MAVIPPAGFEYSVKRAAMRKMASWGSGDFQRTDVPSFLKSWRVRSPWLTASHPGGSFTSSSKATRGEPKSGYQPELPER